MKICIGYIVRKLKLGGFRVVLVFVVDGKNGYNFL